MFSQFNNWATDNNVEFLESELHVYSEKLWIGGILDFVLKLDGKTYIGDLKTSTGIYPEHFFQMSAYDLCLEHMGIDHHIDGYIVVNIPKEGRLKVKTTTDRSANKEAFLSALALHKALKKMNFNPYAS